MKKNTHTTIFWSLILLGGLAFSSCKSKTATDPEAPAAASPAAPDTAVSTNSTTAVQIASSDSLQNGIQDATKDFPLVHAAVDGGVITLTGEIRKDQLPKLMMSLHSLHPKKITNNLIIK
jgi:hypothetical protein